MPAPYRAGPSELIRAENEELRRRLRARLRIRAKQQGKVIEPVPVERPSGPRALFNNLRHTINDLSGLGHPFQAPQIINERVRAARNGGLIDAFKRELDLLDQFQLFFDPIAEAGVASFQKVFGDPSERDLIREAFQGKVPSIDRRFKEPSEDSIDVLKNVLTFQANPLDAAGILRSNFQKRSLTEQFGTGLLLDPLNFIGAGQIKQILSGASKLSPSLASKLSRGGRSSDELLERVAITLDARQQGLPVPVGGASEPELNEFAKALTDEMFEQAGLSEAQQQLQGLDQLITRLTVKNDFQSIQDKAMLELALATGARPGVDISTIKVRQLRSFVEIGRYGGEASGVGGQRIIRGRSSRLDLAQAAAQRHLDQLPADISPEARAFRGGKGGKVSLNSRIQKLASSNPDLKLPSQGKQFRQLVADDIFLHESLEAAAEQLGHESVGVTISSYIRTRGLVPLSLTEREREFVTALRKSSNLESNVAEINKLIKESSGSRRVKGAQGKQFDIGEIRENMGSDALNNMILSGSDETRLRQFAKGTEEHNIADEGLRLLEIRRAMIQAQSFASDLSNRLKAARAFTNEATNAADVKRGRALIKELDTAHKFTRDVGRDLEFFLKQRATTLRNRAAKFDNIELQRIIDDVQIGGAATTAAEAGKRAAIVARSLQRQTAKGIGVRAELEQFETFDPEGAFGQVQKWLDQGSIKTALQERGMDAMLTTHKDVMRVLRKLAVVAPKAFGPDFHDGLTIRSKVLSKAQEARLSRVASVMLANDHLMTPFTSSLRYRGKFLSNQTDALTPVDLGPEVPVKRDVPPPTVPDELSPNRQPIDPPDVIDLDEQLALILTSKRLIGLIDATQQVPFVGKAGAGFIKGLASALTGGRSIFQKELGKLIIIRKHAQQLAQKLGDNAELQLRDTWEKSGVKVVEKREGPGGSSLYFTEDTFALTGKIWEEERYAGLAEIGDLRRFMYAVDLVYAIPVRQWDEYFQMTTEVKDALLWPLRYNEALEAKVFKQARKARVDITKEFGERVEGQYMPRTAVARNGFPIRALVREVMAKEAPPMADTTHFKARRLDHYSDALKEGVYWDNTIESFGHYITTLYDKIAENQIRRRVLPLAFRNSQLNSLQKGSEALTIFAKHFAKFKEAPIDGNIMDRANAVFPHWVNIVHSPAFTKDPDSFMPTIERAARAAQDHRRHALEMRERVKKFDSTILKDLGFNKNEVDEISNLYSIPTHDNIPSAVAGGTVQFIHAVARAGRIPATIMRFVMTGMDAGLFAAQGAPMWYLNPKVAVKGFHHYFWSFWRPDRHNQWRLDNQAELREFRELVGVSGRAEQAEVFDILGSLKPDQPMIGPGEVGALRKGLNKGVGGALSVPSRFETAFTAGLEYIRIEFYKSMKQYYLDRGGDLRDLAAMTNKSTGVYNRTISGSTPFSQAVESSFMFFAPVFRRAVYSLLTDAVSQGYGGRKFMAEGVGGIPTQARMIDGRVTPISEIKKRPINVRRDMAMRNIGGLITVGGIFAAMGFALGNKDAFDPRSPKFTHIPLSNGGSIGFPTPMRTLIRLATNLTLAPFQKDQWDRVRGTGETPFISWDSVLVKWWRGASSPLASGAANLMEGRTFIGETIRDPGEFGPMAAWRAFANTGQPFWAEPAIEREWWAVPLEFLGLNTLPQSKWQERKELQQFIIDMDETPEFVEFKTKWQREHPGETLTFKKLNSADNRLAAELRAKYPELARIEMEVDAETLARGRPVRQLVTQWGQALDSIAEERGQRWRIADREFEATGDYQKFRQRVLEAASEYRDEYIDIQHDEKFADLFDEYFPDRLQDKLDDPDTSMNEIVWEAYKAQVLQNPDVYDEHGNFDFRLFRTAQDDFFTKQYAGWEPVIERRSNVQRDTDFDKFGVSYVKQFYQAQELLSEYWNTHETRWGFDSKQYSMVEDVLSQLPGRQRADFLDRNPSHRRLWKIVERDRERLRKRNPEIDWALVLFHGAAPKHRVNERRLREWQEHNKLISQTGQHSAPPPSEEFIQRQTGQGR